MTTDPREALRRVALAVVAADRADVERRLGCYRIDPSRAGGPQRREFVRLARWRRLAGRAGRTLSRPAPAEGGGGVKWA